MSNTKTKNVYAIPHTTEEESFFRSESESEKAKNIKNLGDQRKRRKMTVKRALGTLTSGADITRPELSIRYVVAATIGVAVLMFAWRAGGVIFDKGGRLVQGHIPGAATPDYKLSLGIN